LAIVSAAAATLQRHDQADQAIEQLALDAHQVVAAARAWQTHRRVI